MRTFSARSFQALIIGDVDTDGTLDVVYGDDQWGEIHALVPNNGFEFMRIDNPEHGVTDVVIADMNMDGINEVMWGAGATSTGPDYWFIADPRLEDGEQIVWQSTDLDGPYNLYAFDPDNTGSFVFASGTSDSGYSGSVAMYIKSPNLTTEWQKVVGDSFDNLYALEMGYINGGQKVLLTVKENYPTMALNYHNLDDGSSHEEYASLTGDGYTAKIVVADMDLDGQPDIIVAAGDTINIVSNKNPGQVDTVAPGCDSPIIDLAVADTTGDGKDIFKNVQIRGFREENAY